MSLLHSPPSCSMWKWKEVSLNPLSSPRLRVKISRNSIPRVGVNTNNSRNNGVISCLFNPLEDPIIKEAIKEPVAFMGGMFAGLLRLDLEEEPLKEWVTRTVEAAGIGKEEIDAAQNATTDEAAPQQIEIE